MSVAAVEIIQSFSYTSLPESEAEWLREAAGYIHARLALSHQMIVEVGAKLLESRARFPYGTWLAWIHQEFDLGDDTLRNYMNLAERMPTLPDGTETMFQIAALYRLTSGNVPEEVRTIAKQRAASGTPIDRQEAYILANAPISVRARYLNAEIPKKMCAELVKALKDRSLPKDVYDYCIRTRVISASIVNYLKMAYHDMHRTRDWDTPRTTWQDIVADDGVLNGIGWSVPLSEATDNDLGRYIQDRRQMHIEKARDSRQAAVATFQGHAVMTLMAGTIILEPTFEVPEYYDGERIEVIIHAKRKAAPPD